MHFDVIISQMPEQLPWYKDGLRFQCTECGKCCSGSPGFVWVTNEEMQEIASFLHISLEAFQKKYTRFAYDRYALIEKKSSSQNYDCIFLKDNKCQVYSHRPKQCRSYPWWIQNLHSEESWKEAAHHCEGISDTAPLISGTEIQRLLQTNNQ